MAWAEQPGSPKESYTVQDGWNIVRTFVVDWSDRYNLLDALLLQGVYAPQPSASISNVDIEPVRETRPTNSGVLDDVDFLTQTFQYNKAELVATYTSKVNALGGSGGSGGGGGGGATNTELREDGILFSYAANGSTELLTRESRGFVWLADSAPVPADVRPTTPVVLSEHTISIGQVETINWDLLDSLQGTVNKYPLRLPVIGRVCLPETVLFSTYNVSVEVPRTLAYESAPLKWRLEIQLIEKTAKRTYFNSTGKFDAIGTFPNRADAVFKPHSVWRDINAVSGSFSYTDTVYVPPGWNSFWRDTKEDADWFGWDELIQENFTSLDPDEWKAVPQKDFNPLFYNYGFLVDTGPGVAIMNAKYPSKTYGTWP